MKRNGWAGVIARRALESAAGVFAFFLRFVRVESELWFWIREIVTFMPGRIGMTARAAFFNTYFKKGAPGLHIEAGAHIDCPQGIEVGERVLFARNTWVTGIGGLRIGASTGIGPGTIIHTANHRYADPNRPWRDQGHELKPVVIDEDVWVCAGAVILPGTCIGRGAVIIAGAVVSGTVQPFAIMGGNPARRVGRRGESSAGAPASNDATA
jgi:acetyltransferase-like isoleucine patch superfamily enzyme